MCLYYNTVAFKKQYPAIIFWRGLTHMRSMCVGVAETGANIVRPRRYLRNFFSLSYFCMTKSTKSHIRGVPPLIYLPPCRLAATRANTLPPTVRQLLNHGYRFETLKRRLGFATVPCRAMANLAVEVWVRVCVRTWRDRVYFDNTVSAQTPSTPAAPLYAGVQAMRARICSTFSCDMFARVVV